MYLKRCTGATKHTHTQIDFRRRVEFTPVGGRSLAASGPIVSALSRKDGRITLFAIEIE